MTNDSIAIIHHGINSGGDFGRIPESDTVRRDFSGKALTKYPTLSIMTLRGSSHLSFFSHAGPAGAGL